MRTYTEIHEATLHYYNYYYYIAVCFPLSARFSKRMKRRSEETDGCRDEGFGARDYQIALFLSKSTIAFIRTGMSDSGRVFRTRARRRRTTSNRSFSLRVARGAAEPLSSVFTGSPGRKKLTPRRPRVVFVRRLNGYIFQRELINW